MLNRLIDEASGYRIECSKFLTRFGERDAGHDLERPLVLDILKTCDLSVLDQKARDIPVVGQPLIKFIIKTVDIAGSVETPHLSLTGGVAQRLERDLYLDDPPPVFDHTLRFHYDVDRKISSVALGIDTILLNTVRIETKYVRTPLIVVRIKPDANVVFSEYIVPLRKGRADLVFLIPTFEGDV